MTHALALAKKWATKYGLDPLIVCAVIEQESGWNPWASRFEPAFEQRYIKPALPEYANYTGNHDSNVLWPHADHGAKWRLSMGGAEVF